MSHGTCSALDELADLCGIEPRYEDTWGRVHIISPEIKSLLLNAMGFDTGTEESLRECLRALRAEQEGEPAPSLLVVTSNGPPERLEFRIPYGLSRENEPELIITMSGEGGFSRESFYGKDEVVRAEPSQASGESFVFYGVPFPEELPEGKYLLDMEIRLGEHRLFHREHLVVCPERAYLPPCFDNGGRKAGLGIALYGLRSERNWGVGDLTDLKMLIDWCVDVLGVSTIGLNPIHAIHNRRPYNVSPYLPLSPEYYNLIYLDVEALPDLEENPMAVSLLESPQVQYRLRELRDSEFVCYEEVVKLKTEFLGLAFDAFEALPAEHPRKRDFKEFLEREGERLEEFALFLALSLEFQERKPPLWIWQDWPEEFQRPDAPGSREFLENHGVKVRFQEYIQWELSRQIQAVEDYAHTKGLSLGLYHDFPLAMDRCGFETWAFSRAYRTGVRVGAPPDGFSPMGQDWGFLPMNRDYLRREAYAHLLGHFRKNCRADSALRIDHVMRFFHLYWIPDGRTPADGAYVTEHFEEILPLLALESVRRRTLIIGEDLGTVPDWIRERLQASNIFSYRLMMFEKNGNGDFLPPEYYPESALVSFSTHDLPTLAGYFKAADIELRKRLNLFIEESDYFEALEERKRDIARLLDRFGMPEPPESAPFTPGEAGADFPTEEVQMAVIEFLAATRSRLVLLNQEDLFLDERQQNVPSTTHERMNWSTKMKYRLEELWSPNLLALGRKVREILERTGRTV